MLIDKPRCNFKNCRYCFDGNCTSADKYENCKVTDLHSEIAKLTVDLDNAKSEVIDDFVKRLLDAFPECNRDARCPAIYYDDYRYIIEEMAEQMKGGE